MGAQARGVNSGIHGVLYWFSSVMKRRIWKWTRFRSLTFFPLLDIHSVGWEEYKYFWSGTWGARRGRVPWSLYPFEFGGPVPANSPPPKPMSDQRPARRRPAPRGPIRLSSRNASGNRVKSPPEFYSVARDIFLPRRDDCQELTEYLSAGIRDDEQSDERPRRRLLFGVPGPRQIATNAYDIVAKFKDQTDLF